MRQFGLIAAITLLALRLCVGWHFYKEGVAKVTDDNWSAAGFLSSAKGPYAEFYHGLVWDRDGSFRLDVERTQATWEFYKSGAAEFFGFDDDQVELANNLVKRHVAQLRWVKSENAEDLEEYELGRERIARLRSDPARTGVASLSGQKDEIISEWQSKGSTALSQIDQVWDNLERAINGIATEEQRERGYYYFEKPRLERIDTSVVDKVIPYFDLAIGLGLLIGLFVRPLAIAGALFLISVVISQFPGYPGTQPTYNQAVEACSMLVLAGFGAGRVAGLDAILFGWRERRKAKKKGES